MDTYRVGNIHKWRHATKGEGSSHFCNAMYECPSLRAFKFERRVRKPSNLHDVINESPAPLI